MQWQEDAHGSGLKEMGLVTLGLRPKDDQEMYCF